MNIYTTNPKGRRILRASRAVGNWYYSRGDLAVKLIDDDTGVVYTITLTRADIALLEDAKTKYLSDA